ncbi:MAG: preprotein translocase subunit SecG, partial [Candidatus Nanoarchaeia archaeon]
MIDIIITVLTVLDVIIALLLIPLILVQQTKDGGFGSAFGGMGESVFGVHAASHLAKLTVIFASAFLVVTLALTVLTGHRNVPKKGILEQQPQIETAATEKAPEKPAQPAETTEVKPDGTIVKKVEGGTITMKPVEQPPSAEPAKSAQKTESVETLPDGTIVKKVEGGTITMKPVKTPPAEKPAETT